MSSVNLVKLCAVAAAFGGLWPACGRVDFDARVDSGTDSASDAAVGGRDGNGGADALLGPDSGAVELCPGSWGSFDVSQPVAELNFDDAFSPSVSADELEIFFLSGSAFELVVSTRSDPSGSFSLPAGVDELNTPAVEDSPSIARERTMLFFTSDRAGGAGGRDIWVAERPAVGQPFGSPANVGALNSGAEESSSWTRDGLTIYFRSDRSGGQGQDDIYRAQRSSLDQDFGAPENVSSINSSSGDEGPSVTIDDLEIFFDSNRPGGLGNDDLWRAVRPGAGEPFGPPQPIAELNTDRRESDPVISIDGTRLYFIHRAATGDYQLWMAERSCMP